MYGCFVSIGSPGDRHKPKVIEKRRPKAESIGLAWTQAQKDACKSVQVGSEAQAKKGNNLSAAQERVDSIKAI